MNFLKNLFSRKRQEQKEKSNITNLGVTSGKDYTLKRFHVEQKFTYRNKTEDTATHNSPSNKYSLHLQVHDLGKNHWKYSRGIVKENSNNKIIADIKRNFSHFPYAWITKNEIEYLICGEDYQGQTIINLTDEKQFNYLHENGLKGGGFCWAAVYPSPDTNFIAVEGCYWAAQYDLVIFDFSQPEALPYKELIRIENIDEIKGWTKEGIFELTKEVEIRKSDRIPYDKLTEQEQDELDDGKVAVDYISKEVKIDPKNL